MINMLFPDGSGSKPRPAVVLSTKRYHQDRADMIVVGLTSNMSDVRYGDHVLNDWRRAGLPLPTKAKAVLATIKRTATKKRIGVLSASDLSGVELGTKEALGL
jgi:mRNA-degrading endonuclease toxin of MazEF toxin-antitoxin module